jgi:hypothetical protein
MILCGNTLEVRSYARPIIYDVKIPHSIRKRSQNAFTKEFRPSNLFRARSNIRSLILCNCLSYLPIFITLTFSEEITDIQYASREFSKFVQRLNYNFQFKLSYVAVPEIQKKREVKFGVGVWHFHALCFNLPYIPNLKQRLESLWGHGFTNYRTTWNDPVHVANYLAKYLTKENFEIRLFGRRRYYPSRNLKRPQKIFHESATTYFSENILSQLPLSKKIRSFPEWFQEITYEKYQLTDLQKAQFEIFSSS